MIEWKEKKFQELTTKELYEISRVRSEVFVVEQEILYNDFDRKDYKAIHLSGFIEEELVAYARIFDKGDYYKNYPGFGRVAVIEKERGNLTSSLIWLERSSALGSSTAQMKMRQALIHEL